MSVINTLRTKKIFLYAGIVFALFGVIAALPVIQHAVVTFTELHVVHKSLNGDYWGAIINGYGIYFIVIGLCLFIYNYENKAYLSVIIIFTYALSVCAGLSNLYNAMSGTDSSVFRYMGMLMAKGYVPYRDSFDHKGPLLYFINYLGYLIDKDNGVWLFEIASIFLTFLYFYKTAALFCNKQAALLSLFLPFYLLKNCFFEGGNLTEEYAMPCIMASLYIFTDYLKNKQVTNVRLAICGALFGFVLLLRPNMIAVWVVYCLYIFVMTIINRQFKELWRFILFFCIGLVVVILPFIIYYAAKQALSDLVDCYILFNKEYINSDTNGSFLTKLRSQKSAFVNFAYLSAAGIICTVISVFGKSRVYTINAIYYVLTLLFLSISGRTYGHYGMVLIPCLAVSVAYVLNELNVNKIIYHVCMCFFLIFSILNYRVNYDVGDVEKEIVDYIQSVVSKEDCISVYGNRDYFYVKSQRMSASRYSYQFPIGQVKTEIMDSYFEDLNKNKPEIIMLQVSDDRILQYLHENDYEKVMEGAGVVLYRRAGK